MLSKRVQQIKPSAIFDIIQKAKKLESEGEDVIRFGAGESEFDTPENIRQRAIEAIDGGFTRYTPASGIIELKTAICEKLKKENGLEYSPDEVIVSCGAKQALFNAVLTLCDSGDEVLLPAPCWVSYADMARLAGAKPIILQTAKEQGFKVTAEQLQKAITSKTKAIILNSPSNPTGSVYTRDELEKIAKIIVDNDIYCISDEIYEKIIYDTYEHVSIASLNSEIKSRTVVVNGVSKTYAMTGWRIGYAAGPREIISAMSKIQGHSTSNPTSISQMAALEAINGPQESVGQMVRAFKERRDYVVDKVKSINGLSCLNPQGAFYAWLNISELIGKKYGNVKIVDSLTFADLLLTESKVAVIAGVAFSSKGHVRISFAIPLERVKEGMRRIENFVASLK